MSKLGCVCGAVIFDNGDHLPCKAAVLPDADRDAFVAAATASAVKQLFDGEDPLFLRPSVPRTRDEIQAMCSRLKLKISDAIETALTRFGFDALECEDCGRVYLLRDNRHSVSFRSCYDQYYGVLRPRNPEDRDAAG